MPCRRPFGVCGEHILPMPLSQPPFKRGEIAAVNGSFFYAGLGVMGYKEAITFRELYKAAKQCARGVRWKESVQDYLRNMLARTFILCRELEQGRYRLQPYVRFLIYTPKVREIVSTRLRDRVVQRAMCNNGLYADLVRGFIYDNCACLVGRGVHFAQKRMATHLHRFYRRHGTTGWVLKMDIRKFFSIHPPHHRPCSRGQAGA